MERQIAEQQLAGDNDALQDAATLAVRVPIHLRSSLPQLAERIDVPIETIRDWAQGRRCPTGAARALFKILDREPKAALRAFEV